MITCLRIILDGQISWGITAANKRRVSNSSLLYHITQTQT